MGMPGRSPPAKFKPGDAAKQYKALKSKDLEENGASAPNRLWGRGTADAGKEPNKTVLRRAWRLFIAFNCREVKSELRKLSTHVIKTVMLGAGCLTEHRMLDGANSQTGIFIGKEANKKSCYKKVD